MRSLPASFRSGILTGDRHPCFAVQIGFSVSTPTLTSDTVSNLPSGGNYAGVIKDVSSISQKVFPTEGRATIGGVTIQFVEDSSNPFSDELNDQLGTNFEGIRNKEVRIYVGWRMDGVFDWDTFTQVHTASADNLTYKDGLWTLKCRDTTKSLRERVFEPASTRVTADLGGDITSPLGTITVADTDDFEEITHGAGWAHLPSTSVGYLLIEDTEEIIAWCGKTSTTFTIIERGCFNTKPQEVTVDGTQDPDQFPEVTEFIYLDLPGVQAAIAVMTGILDTTASPRPTTPDHWHLGMDWDAQFNQSQWTGIGTDIWEPGDLSKGIPVYFQYLEEVEGKAFIEKEIMRLLGLYMPVDRLGKIGLRRVNRVPQDSARVTTLHSAHVTSYNDLTYNQTAVVNQFEVKWDYDGERYRRSVLLQDNDSISKHGASPRKTLSFRGLHTARHTKRLIQEVFGFLQDRYAEPPLELTATTNGFTISAEVGDTVGVELDGIKDYITSAAIDRSFEVQEERISWAAGTIDYKLFASARLVESQPGNDETDAPIDDSWYTASGTDIATLPSYSAGSPATLAGTHSLSGGATTEASGSIYYHDGDLDISGTLNITGNIQLRVNGFLTLQGTIDGESGGYDGATDSDSEAATSTGWTKSGTAGFIGITESGPGIAYLYSSPNNDWLATIPGEQIEGAHQAAAPSLDIQIDGATVKGLDIDLRGTSGSSGGQHIRGDVLARSAWITAASSTETGGTVRDPGGKGGDSGAGLMIISRGFAFEGNGKVNLSGDDGARGEVFTAASYDVEDVSRSDLTDYLMRSGRGAGGYPGAFYVILDGDDLLRPNVSGTNTVLERGTNIESSDVHSADRLFNESWYPVLLWPTGTPSAGQSSSPIVPMQGLPGELTTRKNLWQSAQRTQYAPNTGAPAETPIPVPGGLTFTTGPGWARANWGWAGPASVDVVEVFLASVNDRSFAEKEGEVAGNAITIRKAAGGTFYGWLRARKGARLSEYSPNGATSGVSVTIPEGDIEFRFTAPIKTWTGDLDTSPNTWTPSDTTTQVTAKLYSSGALQGTEIIDVTRDSTGDLTLAYDTNDANITSSWTATPANTVEITFADPVTGYSDSVTLTAVASGAGPTGPPGDVGPPGPQAGLKINYSTFAASNPGEIYFHGVDSSGDPADVDPVILINGVRTTVTKDTFWCGMDTPEGGWLVIDTLRRSPAPFLTDSGSAWSVQARKIRQLGVTKWQYDKNGVAWVDFTPDKDMVVIGSCVLDTSGGENIESAQLLGGALDLGTVPAMNLPSLLAAKMNYNTFTNADDGEFYLHGQDAVGNAADVAGEVVVNGAWQAVGPGVVGTQRNNSLGGWIVWDYAEPSPANFPGVQGFNQNIAPCRKIRNAGTVNWQYDDAGSGTWTQFTTTDTMVIIGSYKSAGADDLAQVTVFPNAPLLLSDVPVESATEAPVTIDDLTADLNAIPIITGALPDPTTYTDSNIIYHNDTGRLYSISTDSPKQWRLSVDPDDFVSDILETHIGDDQITTPKIGANEVVAKHLVVAASDGKTMNADPTFQSENVGTDEAWIYKSGSGASITTFTTAVPVGGRRCLESSGTPVVFCTELLPCSILKGYQASGWVNDAGSGSKTLKLGVYFYDNTDTLITAGSLSPDATGWTSIGDGHYFYDADPAGGWNGSIKTIMFGINADAQIPSGAVSMRIGVEFNVSGAAASLQQVADLKIDEQVSSGLIQTNAIIADKIAAGAIESAKLESTLILADTMTVKGLLDATRIKAATDDAFVVETSSGEYATPFLTRFMNAWDTNDDISLPNPASPAAYASLGTIAVFYHPGYTSGVNEGRLAVVQQYFRVAVMIWFSSNSGSTETAKVKLQYKYDGGTWTDLAASEKSVSLPANATRLMAARMSHKLKAKASGWTDDLLIRVVAGAASHNSIDAIHSAEVSVANIGSQGVTGVTTLS